MGVLSVDGRRKTVVGLEETTKAVKELLVESKLSAYNLQVASMLLVILYLGVRLSSLVPKEKCFEHEWKFLKWKHITIYRQGRYSRGYCFILQIGFQHVKNKKNEMNTAAHVFTRSFSSRSNCFSDLPFVLISFLISRNFLTGYFTHWYMRGDLTLAIKEEALELPVFCRNDRGGHHGVLSNEVWFGQNADKAIAKAFKDCNIATPILAYALRRNFIQKAQEVTDDKKVVIIAGH